MTKRIVTLIGALSFFLVALPITVLVVKEVHGMQKENKTIRVYMGEPLTQLFAETGEVPHPDDSDHQPYIWPRGDEMFPPSFRVVLGRPGSEVVFPSCRLVWIEQYAAVIYAVTLNTSEEKGSLRKIYDELSGWRTSFLQAGWLEDSKLKSYEELSALIRSSQGTTNGLPGVSFKKDGDEALLLLSTPGAVVTPDTLNNAAFAVEIEVENKKLEDDLAEKTYGLRKKLNGSDGVYVLLSYWLEKQAQTH